MRTLISCLYIKPHSFFRKSLYLATPKVNDLIMNAENKRFELK